MAHDDKLNSVRFRISAIAIIALATLSLSWPSFINKGPFFIADTTAYLRSVDAAISEIFNYHSKWSDRRDIYKKYHENAVIARTDEATTSLPSHPPLIGRSIYYGAFIYVPALLFGEQMAVLVQAVLSAIVIWLALIPAGFSSRKQQLIAYASAIGVLALATSIPFTTTLLVPDYLTGLGCASLIVLMCFWRAYGRMERVILGAVIVLAAISHSSNLPLLFGLSVLGFLASLRVPVSAKAAIIGLGAVGIGAAGEAVFVSAVRQNIGIAPIRPPFLTARLIADGPGYQLLRSRCSIKMFEVCRYLNRTPHDSDLFLWSEGPEGVFMVADLNSQRRLSDEDLKFALTTFRELPLATISSSFEAFVLQIGMLDLRIWEGNTKGHEFYDIENLPDEVATQMSKTLSVRGEMKIDFSQFLIRVTSLVGLMAVFYIFVHATRADDRKLKTIGMSLAFVILAIAMNAAITGGLSKPDARYNLRIIWLLPFFGLIYTFAATLASRPDHVESD